MLFIFVVLLGLVLLAGHHFDMLEKTRNHVAERPAFALLQMLHASQAIVEITLREIASKDSPLGAQEHADRRLQRQERTKGSEEYSSPRHGLISGRSAGRVGSCPGKHAGDCPA